MNAGAKRYFVDPFGCAKNQVDAENMMACLGKAGWDAAPDSETADLIIVNSCGFIESAKLESINAVLAWRTRYPNKKIILAGCLAQRYAQDLAESLPEADALFGIGDITQIAAAANSVCETDISREFFSQGRRCAENSGHRPLLSLPGSAYVKISEGCDNRCSYCAIPLIRGGLACRAVPDIVDECKALLERGITELCIIGQDICAYRSNGSALPELLDAISQLPGQFWVRLLYMHPGHFPLRILDIMERDPRFIPYFDIPFQHASEKILRAMNRKSSATAGNAAEAHLALVETIRQRLPAAVIRSTFLLGFPGETDKDFLALCGFQEKASLDWLGCFAYSREEGTPAWSMPAQVPKRIAERRKKIIEERQIPITERKLDRYIGLQCEVLVEERTNKKISGNNNFVSFIGRLYSQAPDVDGAALISGSSDIAPGSLVPCTVIARQGFDLIVEVLK